jgi:FkbM family methyltransferase
MTTRILGSHGLARLLDAAAPLRILDIGARGGLTPDLRALGTAVDVYGIEPDPEECARLTEQHAQPSATYYGRVQFFPAALGRPEKGRTMYVTSRRGSSTMLKPITAVAEAFDRPQFMVVEETRTLETVALDSFLQDAGIGAIDFVKMDVEGLELEILQGARELLSTTLHVLRTEVAHVVTREGQPTAAEIDVFLRDFGFEPLDMLEMHHWRPLSRRHHLRWDRRAKLPFSRGQLIHGDVLYVRNLTQLHQRPVAERVRAAFLLLAYGFADHAYLLLDHADVQRECVEPLGVNLQREMRIASRSLASRYRWDRLMRAMGLPRDLPVPSRPNRRR